MDKDCLRRILAKTKENSNGCWEFTGWGDGKDYKKIWFNGRGHYVHRLMFEWFHRRKLRRNVQVDHICCNRACCNPLHLQAVMNKKNARLREKRKRNGNKN